MERIRAVVAGFKIGHETIEGTCLRLNNLLPKLGVEDVTDMDIDSNERLVLKYSLDKHTPTGEAPKRELHTPRRIFLGGTCNGSIWRIAMMAKLDKLGIEYFNPVVKDWNDETQVREELEKNEKCDWQMYCLTPRMKGMFSIVEATIAAAKNPRKTIIVVIGGEQIKRNNYLSWTKEQWRSLEACIKVWEAQGLGVLHSLAQVEAFLMLLKKEDEK